MATEFLRLEQISKGFAGVQALKDVSLTINSGEIVCLVGENGSGKSTLIKIIAGVYHPDEGQVFINGKEFPKLHPIDSIREGIQVIYQDFSLFPNLTVAENVALNLEVSKGKQLVNWKEVRQIAKKALDQINVKIDLDAIVEDLPVVDRQLIAIAKALLQEARLIIMDEPTTALTKKEIQSLFSVIKDLKMAGISTLFVSHKLDEVIEISDRTVILRNGEKMVDRPANELNRGSMIRYMTGQDIDIDSIKTQPLAAETPDVLVVENLTLPGYFHDISFSLKKGEILGITGLLGSGRTSLALALFGLLPAGSGKILLEGKPVRIRNVQDALRSGIGYVPEDRLKEGLFLPQAIGKNVIVRIIDELVHVSNITNHKMVADRTQDWVKRLSIKTKDTSLPVSSLSGGNQQRVVLAKWLASNPKVLILNGPTVGVDIGSKQEIHDIVRDLAQKGMGLIVISDDIPELMQLSHRILLMKHGRVAEEFDRRVISEKEINALLVETE